MQMRRLRARSDAQIADLSVRMSAQMQAMQSAGAWGQARNFAVMTGVNSGLSLAVKKYRGGVDDVRGA